MNKRLYRSTTDRMLGGIAGGVADYLAADPSLVRVAWAILVIFSGGAFFLLYIIMWIVVPDRPMGTSDPPVPAAGGGPDAEPGAWNTSAPGSRPRGDAGVVVGLLLMGLGAWFLVREFIPQLNLDRLWPVGLVALGVVMILLTMRRPSA